MALEVYQVDAFADQPFTGNPAAVVPLAAARDAAWMQAVAAEMNLSETAFLVPRGAAAAGGGAEWDLRWFTPEVEMELCGHATLAAAHVLWETGRLPAAASVRFHTLSGVLAAERRDGLVELDFPALPPVAEPRPWPQVAAVVGAEPVWVGRRGESLVVQLEDEAAVRGLAPDLTGLLQLADGLIATARATTPAFDFVSRYFAPGVGIAEDPVTGYAHCVLTPFWAERLGRDEMSAYQASRRGGVVRVRLAGDRVRLGGRAVTVLRGELTPAAAGD
ncbi:MAG TPA: PhzF family phenazine biosynthesis protein [Thermoanaerobaculia bacterium]|nr:PhzF family phenazine biosynthesis protein [Thermoanaerobaculia bacterium]